MPDGKENEYENENENDESLRPLRRMVSSVFTSAIRGQKISEIGLATISVH